MFLDASENVAALSNISSIPEFDLKNVLYWFMGEENTTGSLLINGRFVQGFNRHPCDFGHMILPGGTTLGTAIHRCKTAEELVDAIKYPLHTVIQLLAPHSIILECEQFKSDRDRIAQLIRESLHQHYRYPMRSLPDIYITCCKFRHAHRGLAIQLRNMWIDQVLQA